MMLLETVSVICPYCGETFATLADTSAGAQSYIEDCSVCCQPINFYLTVGENGERSSLVVTRDDE